VTAIIDAMRRVLVRTAERTLYGTAALAVYAILGGAPSFVWPE